MRGFVTCITKLAKKALREHDGIGINPPFYAETASVKGDQDWPYWIVRNATCNSLGEFMPRDLAVALSAEMNRQVGKSSAKSTGAAP